MPSEEVILEHFNAFLTEYFINRSITGIQEYLAPEITSFGTSANEVMANLAELIAAMKIDLEQVPEPTTLSDASFKVERLNDSIAVVWGRVNIQGRSNEISFEISGCRMSAVFTIIDAKLLISHWHISHPQELPGEPPESWPIRRIRESHHETTEKYRIVFETSPVGIEVFDEKGIITDCNKKFLDIFQLPREKIIGLCLFDLPDKQVGENVRKTLSGKTSYYESYFSALGSRPAPIRVLSTPIFTANSRISGGIAIVEDMSEPRKSQDLLQYQLQFEKMVSSVAQSLVRAPIEQIDQIVENALQLSSRFFDAERGYIFQVDSEGRTLTNTHEWCAPSIEPLMPKYQKYPLDQLPAVLEFHRHAVEYLHFPDVDAMPETMADFKELLIADNVKSILLLPMLAQGKFIGLFGYDCVESRRSWSFEEITLLKVIAEMFSNAFYKKNSEKQIRESEEKYRFLAENINDIIWVLDVDVFKYSYISPSVCQIFGYTPEELMQKEVSVTLTPASLQRVNEYIPERLANLRNNGQTRYTEELEQIHKDGHTIITELTQNWVINPVTRHAEIIGITRDITERKELEEQKRLIEIHRQQSLKADSLGRMAGSIAHHFNNQLQVILGNLELMALDRQKSGTVSKNVSDAIRATHKASEMSALMLTYLGQHQAEGQISNLHELCNSQLKVLQKHLPETHKLILTDSAPDEKVNINRDHFFQILRNVIANASEACSADSATIFIDIAKIQTSKIPVKNRFPLEWVPEQQHYICLQVKDNGCGIPDEDIFKTFDPFFSTKGPGRGLGLANALGFMRGIGGGITLSSQQHQGSTFCFYFPCVKDSSKQPAAASKKSRKQTRCEMILVIEDEEMVRFITRSLLENFNYKVLEAESGGKALEILSALKEQIDLVICDLVMPDMDGWQTLEELRKIAPGIPVILASGYDQDYIMRGEHQQQPQAFLRKPYNSIGLQQAIEQALS